MEQPSPTNAAQLAALAVNTTQKVTGIELNYAVASLNDIDSLICGFRDQGLTAETMNESMCILGCYLGEVIIRNHGGTWKLASETAFKNVAPADLLVLETPNGTVWNPIGKAFKLLKNGMDDSVAFFYSVATSNLPA